MRLVALALAPLLLAGTVAATTATAEAATGTAAGAGAGAGASVTLTVGKAGAEYTTVQAAVNAVPDDSATPYTILIRPGTYDETVTIPASKHHLTLLGSTHNPADVVISAANYNGEPDPAGGTYGTEGSATVHVKASNFTAEYITFSNSFDKNDYPTVTGTQAVAVAMEGDRQVYQHDIFYGHQDTLLSWDSSATTALRQYVYDSTIEGDVDFIFGNGDLVVDRSHIEALNDGIYQKAYLTAPATYGTDPYGILLTGSTVTSTLAPDDVYLGRAWVPYTGAVPQLTVRDTNLPPQVNATDPYLGISGATWTAGRYGEYANTGYGANPDSPSRPQLTAAAAAAGTAQAALAGSDGWDPVAPGPAGPDAPGTVAQQALRQSSATGDTRRVTRPRIPATCQTVTSALARPANRMFGDALESAAPDTARIQAALNACQNSGQAVVLVAAGADTAFLSAPLTIGNGEFLVLGRGVTLFASRKASDYQEAGSSGTCGTIAASSSGCNAFITVTGSDSGIEAEGTAGGPGLAGSPGARGDQGTIDGRGDLPILGTAASWWQNAVTAKAENLKQVNPRLIQATDADNLTIYNLTLENSPKEHLYDKTGGGLLVWGLTIRTSDASLNTDGVDFDSSAYGTITHSDITDGDDCVAMQTNDATDAHITVGGNQCYGTHGISIGSETTYGLESILAERNLIDGKDSSGTESSIAAGIRVKSYAGAGGLVTDVVYADTTMRGLQYPIDIDPFYDPPTGTSYPDFAGITVDGATETGSVPGAESVLKGYSPADPLGLTLRDVYFDTTATQAQDAHVTEVHSNLVITGPGVTVTRGR
ncbi:MAG TPA: pectinesterase family protein [Streptosporangiaceae bacterium]|nr:pectinesterase family protein [Streptosporangiaceae bacterium]